MSARASTRTVRWFAPGRVNLIGEHTDYNSGFALPFAIGQGCVAAVQDRTDGVIALESAQRGAVPPVRAAELQPGASVAAGWAGYAYGVLWAVQARGVELPGLSIQLDSDVPVGSGLSSSAALVCSVATAIDDLLDLRLSATDLLAITRSAENDFVGAPTGGMDQLAALHCTADHALFCDMRNLDTEQVPFELGAHVLLVIDTRAEHRHADGEYRRRRAGCERAASELGVGSLRDVSPTELPAALDRLSDDELRRYTRHVVTENDRVLRSVAALRTGDLPALGALLSASHASMRDDFRISGPELDLAVDTVHSAGALGARLTGGGFGGCVIALLPEDAIGAAETAVRAAYRAAGFAEPVVFPAHPARGAYRLS